MKLQRVLLGALLVMATQRSVGARISVLAEGGGAELADARFPRESGLVADEARFEYRCQPHEDGVVSQLEEHLVVRNPTGAPIAAIAVARGDWHDELGAVTVDGVAAVPATLGPEDLHAFDCAYHVAVTREPVAMCPAGGDGGGVAFRFVVAPGARREIVFRDTRTVVGSYATPNDGATLTDGVTTRHPFLAQPFYTGATEILVSDARELTTLRGNPKIRVHAVAPESWRIFGRYDPVRSAANGDFVIGTFETDLAAIEARRIPDPPTNPPGAVGIHHIAPFLIETTVVRPGHQVVANGGFYVAIGARVGSDSDAHARFRVGYEVAFFEPWFLGSVSADFDTAGRVLVTPVVEVAAPFVPIALLAPSFSLGVGLPVQVAPETRVGLRVVASACYPVVGVEAAMDYFPASGASPEDVQWTVLGRLGF